VKGVAYDTPILGYRRAHLQHAAALEGRSVESFDFEAFNHGDYYRAVEQKMASENITKVSTERRDRAGQDPAPAAAVLLRELLAAGHGQAATWPWAGRWSGSTRRGRSSSTTPTRHRRGRTDAAARGRTRAPLGDGVGRSRRRHWPTRTTPSCAEALESGRSSCSAGSCRATWRSSTRSTAVRRRDPLAVRGRRGARGAHVDHRRGRRARRAHGAPGHGRQPHGQRRRRAPFPSAHRDVLRDFYELWPGKFANVTNGVTPRRFLAVSNPPLARSSPAGLATPG